MAKSKVNDWQPNKEAKQGVILRLFNKKLKTNYTYDEYLKFIGKLKRKTPQS